MGRITRRKRNWVLVVALAVVSSAASVAWAKSGPSQVRVPMLPSRLTQTGVTCPPSPDKKPAGTATLTRDKGVLKVSLSLHRAVPATYQLLVGYFDTNTNMCVQAIPAIDSFKVDASGDGRGSGTVAFPDQEFLVAALSLNPFSLYLSPLVKMGST